MNPWLQVLLSLAVGSVTAVAAVFGVRMSVRGNDRATEQRELAARREEWWRRFTFAAELTLADSEQKRVAGLNLLTMLAQSDLALRDEYLLLDTFQARVLEDKPSITEETVAAARNRVVLDEKLGRDTPKNIRDVADRLTGALLMRSFEEAAEPVLAQAVAAGSPSWLILVDVDGMQRINKTRGHRGGDDVLRELGRLLAQLCRPGDLLARYGGDEFVALIIGDGVAVAKRMRDTVAAHDWTPVLGDPDGPSVSVGVAKARGDEDLSALLIRVDALKRLAKREGRDQVRIG